MKQVTMFTDGSCCGSRGPGGYAAILVCGPLNKEVYGRHQNTTNNQMELWAVMAGLLALNQPCKVTIHTDSKYVRGIFQEGWLEKWKRNGWKTASKKPVANKELILDLSNLVEQHEVKFEWLKGHSGVKLNEKCDELARWQAEIAKGEVK